MNEWIVFNKKRLRTASINSYEQQGSVVSLYQSMIGHTHEFDSEEDASKFIFALDNLFNQPKGLT